jgi:hypothetical protein
MLAKLGPPSGRPFFLHRLLAQRIDSFVSLPIASLDRLALHERLREIGRL